jgi:hypothetical protein
MRLPPLKHYGGLRRYDLAHASARELASFATDQKEGLRKVSARRWHFLLPPTTGRWLRLAGIRAAKFNFSAKN